MLPAPASQLDDEGLPITADTAPVSAKVAAATDEVLLTHAAAEPVAEAGPMRARSVGSAADRARAAIGPGMAGLRAAAERGRQAVPSADEVRRGRTELLSAAVLVLALLGALLAFGGLDVAHAAAEGGSGGSSGLEGN
jgi:hypothetical protein